MKKRNVTGPLLVLSGREYKLTLERDFDACPGHIRVDYLRFTVPLDTVVQAKLGLPLDLSWSDVFAPREKQNALDVVRQCRSADMAAQIPANSRAVSRAAARWLVGMCPKLTVGLTDDKGSDFYLARTAIMHEMQIVGYALAGGTNQAQAQTVHFNLPGSATVHMGAPALGSIATALVTCHGWITRCDLALDVFKGFDITQLPGQYLEGMFDVRGKRPKEQLHGSWTSGHSRTFQVGARSTGKMLRIYEKGDELFGHEENDPWIRIEVEFRNNKRILPPDMLVNSQQYFAGAYDYCAEKLAEYAQANPVSIATQNRLTDKTADAAVSGVIRWLKGSAAPALLAVMEHGGDMLDELILGELGRVPGRLRGFKAASIRAAFMRISQVSAVKEKVIRKAFQDADWSTKASRDFAPVAMA